MPPAALRALAPLPAPEGGSRSGRAAGVVSRALQDSWVARLKARDPEALRDVVQAFTERLTAVVSGMLRDRDAVDDVVQETFAKAWFRIQAFQGDSSLYTWLYRVAINGCKDHAKRRARRPAGSLDALLSEPEGATGSGAPSLRTSNLRAPTPHPLEGLERRELRLAVQAAIAELPQHFRAVLALREIEGLSYQEIAAVMSLSLGTVESRLFRARQRLAALLVKQGLSGGTDDATAGP